MMNTDEYKTCRCEICRQHASIKSVHVIKWGSDLYWLCRDCILGHTSPVRCESCKTSFGQLYKFGQANFCGSCISGTPTVQKALETNDNAVLKMDLGTDEPPKEDSLIEGDWKELSRGVWL